MCMSVDLPDPEGPTIATYSLSSTLQGHAAQCGDLELAVPVDLLDVDQLDDRRDRRLVLLGIASPAGPLVPPVPAGDVAPLPDDVEPVPAPLASVVDVTTTWSPSLRPVVISTKPFADGPVVTTRVWVGPDSVPFVATITVDFPLLVVTAFVGTRSTFGIAFVATAPITLAPT